MSFILACKAFFKAFSDPAAGKKFVDGTPPVKESTDPSHLQLLTLLQQSGRLIDFFKEDISSYNDEQVGAAVRKIHQDCGKVLEDFVTIRSVLDQDEGASMNIQPGYDPQQIKLVGKVKGNPPYKGTVVHKGWKAHKRNLPKQMQSHSTNDILSPAEVEIH